MHKFLIALLIVLISTGCKRQPGEEVMLQEEEQDFSFRNMPKTPEINSAAGEILKDWKEYQDLENSFSVLRRASNTEDLKLAIDDLIEKEVAMAQGEYPAPFDQLQIRSRQRVLRTFLLKIKGNLAENRDVEEPMKQMLEGYNALKNQFNRITSNTLDKKLILNEE